MFLREMGGDLIPHVALFEDFLQQSLAELSRVWGNLMDGFLPMPRLKQGDNQEAGGDEHRGVWRHPRRFPRVFYWKASGRLTEPMTS